ncbi:MAG: peptidylprolyl isomerase [Clostridia bacterium]|nr:peptidylprolyl isomerase [Clostridia bacterium]MBR1684123.1 peptidylprolyl isomerase [Clostridia bacterium]
MKLHSRLLALLTALLMTLTMLPAFAETTEDDSDTVLAVIGGETEVLKGEVDEVLDEIVSYYTQYGVDMTSEDMLSVARQMAMETYLQTAFYDATAKSLGLDPLSEDDALELLTQIDSVYEDLIAQVYTYYGLEPAEDATDEEKASARESAISMLDLMGYTYDYIAVTEKQNFLYEKVNQVLTADLSVPFDQVVEAYNAHVADDEATYANDPSTYEIYTAYYGYEPYFVPQGFRGITHILLSVDEDLLATYQDLQNRFEEQAEPDDTEAEDALEDTDTEDEAEAEESEPVTEAEVEAAKAAVIASVQDVIDEIHAKLDAGTPWSELVAEYSTDPGMQQEPNKTYGYSVFSDSMMYDPAFVQAAFSIDNIGDVSEPYVGMYGIYIVHYTRDVPSGPVELTDELRAEIEEELLSDVTNETIENAYHAWQESVDIVYTEAGEAYRPEEIENVDEIE